ncbi:MULTISPECIES: hypothetical protein [Pseudomonas]|uniref:hypothetical protein n=1 Tax=Pseudomonas TaxID=286 RepID=UPI0005ACB7C5|nr:MULTISPECIES: hypothetical protein [Pseudomonas]KIQ07467.1 hypothetical protein RU03_27545 [Pseudomonas simiae]MBC3962536.1 hypothetical protein [Pseudomonas simiae]
MIEFQTRVFRNNNDTLTRVLEEKRAVEEEIDTGSATARAIHNQKYAVIFDAIIAKHASDAGLSKL